MQDWRPGRLWTVVFLSTNALVDPIKHRTDHYVGNTGAYWGELDSEDGDPVKVLWACTRLQT